MVEAVVGQVTRDVAKRELARRELARRHLVDFSCYVAPWYRPARHHRLVAEYLEQVETFVRTGGKTGIGRLLIFEPPRHGKTEQASRHFPAWVLGRNPDKRVILASYGADLAVANSRSVRGLLTDEKFAPVFGGLATVDQPVELSQDSRSAEAWDLAAPHRGGLVAAGVGGGITGKGAHLFVVDDPFKNRDEAESETTRERVWDWWTSTAYTRLENGGAVIGMLTRWHGDDWAGRLLKMMASGDPHADKYVVLNLPAIWEDASWGEEEEGDHEPHERHEKKKKKSFEEFQRERMLEGVWVEERDLLDRRDGEALWPEKYDVTDLERIRANVGEYDFSALYMQNPYSKSGAMFSRENFVIVDAPPMDAVARVRMWDKAGSKKGDWTVGTLTSIDGAGVITVEHVERGRWKAFERDQRMLETARLDAQRLGPVTAIWHYQDPGSAGIDSAISTNRVLAGFPVHYEQVTGDKETNAEPWAGGCQAGLVRLVRGGWNEAFIAEHVAFPKGKHDDQVDSASGAYKKVVNRSRGIYIGED
jgi:predicted phage terminase large subunit-like protein